LAIKSQKNISNQITNCPKKTAGKIGGKNGGVLWNPASPSFPQKSGDQILVFRAFVRPRGNLNLKKWLKIRFFAKNRQTVL
jgi:hypothetical protein